MPDNDILDATDTNYTMQHLIAFQLFQISCSATEAFGKEARESRASSPKIVYADDYSSNTTNNFHGPFLHKEAVAPPYIQIIQTCQSQILLCLSYCHSTLHYIRYVPERNLFEPFNSSLAYQIFPRENIKLTSSNERGTARNV